MVAEQAVGSDRCAVRVHNTLKHVARSQATQLVSAPPEDLLRRSVAIGDNTAGIADDEAFLRRFRH